MSELLISENDFAPLGACTELPEVLDLMDCDLLAQGPPRELAGVTELNIEDCRLTAEALGLWLAATPDLSILDVDGAQLGELSWRLLPPRLTELCIRGGQLVRMVDAPVTSGLAVIELTSCGLEGLELSPSLPGLQSISLAYNRTLGRCPELPWSAAPFGLDLRGVGLDRWPLVAGVDKVSKLDLSFNALGELPAQVGNCSSLGSLRLEQCELTVVDEALGSLPHLRELWLKDNRLATMPEGIFQLPALRILDVTRCGLSALSERIGELAGLEVLLLSENAVPRLPEAILSLKQLRNLQLWKTGLADLPASLSGLRQLQQLELSYNSLSCLPDLGELPSLGYLGLCGLGQLDWRQGFDVLARLQCVGMISLSNNGFDHFDRRVLAVPGLHRLDVNGTAVDAEEWRQLRRENPETVIWSG